RPWRWGAISPRSHTQAQERLRDPADADDPGARARNRSQETGTGTVELSIKDDDMYEEYFGFTEKPFSLTPDPKYLFKSESHANAFELLQYAIRRREGF